MLFEESLTQARAESKIAAHLIPESNSYVGYDFSGDTPRAIVICETLRSHPTAPHPVALDLARDDWEVLDATDLSQTQEAIKESVLALRQTALQDELDDVQASLLEVQSARASRLNAGRDAVLGG